ncbi:alpha/beta hydrolase [Sphingomonas colocasiae]|uniref:Alpha/beta hydrolase n=1 Tax=Sphingomonas colocasiae TaxID=1848973 RepID=A0ABS7PS46_9SPHN|nr:alpha/beta hydrolase-fold protein [Sphingomonas colocasiae]MBY8824150.1 hypothetical protein [Sphingomonas colocasiae]
MLIASACAGPACAQAASDLVEPVQGDARPYSRHGSVEWTLRSRSGRLFQIYVARPDEPPPEQGYPVIYVTDPSWSFATLADTLWQSRRLYGPAVVVGVGYPSAAEIANRSYDLTIARLPDADDEHRGAAGPTGGAEAFFGFIEEELKPVVEKAMPIDRSRQALFGHSFGGLFALHVLFSHPESFDTYVAGSPSIWWGGDAVLREKDAFVSGRGSGDAPRRLLLTVGGLEEELTEDFVQAKKRGLDLPSASVLKGYAMVRKTRGLAEDLKRVPGLVVDLRVYEGETHPSSIPAYLGSGGRFAMSGWVSD